MNPQRWNLYAYAVNNPLKYTDPDGRDAILVNYSQGAPISGHFFGHNGIAVVSPDGSVTFSDFGPAAGRGIVAVGRVNTRSLSAQVRFGPDGQPTRESLVELAQELEALQSAPPGSVQLAYYKTDSSETNALAAWVAQSPQYAPYFMFTSNCGNYDRDGMASIGKRRASTPRGNFSVPNIDFLMFSMFADARLKSAKPTVKTEITGWRFAPK